jgi:hypothetical protein
MNADNVFGLFDSEEVGPDVKKITDVTQYPTIFIKLFVKFVNNIDPLNEVMAKTLKKMGGDADLEKLKYANKLISVARAYEIIQEFDFQDNTHVEALLEEDAEEVLAACTYMLQVLTRYEEYEKCAFIKDLKDFITFSQKKLLL